MDLLALIEAPDHISYRVRVAAFRPALARRGLVLHVQPLARPLARRLGQLRRAREYDAVLLQRKLLDRLQFGLLRRSARRLVYDFDDAVPFGDSHDPRGIFRPGRLDRFARVAREADAVIAGNAFLRTLARSARGHSPAEVALIPTAVPLYPSTMTPGPPRPDGLRLAWLGSSSTLRALEHSRALWDAIGGEPGLATLRVICDRFPDLGRLAVEPVRWSREAEEAALTGADVGVAWMPDDAWSLGKCGLKVLQYQAAGLPVVANPVGVHRTLITPGVTGFLAETPGEWRNALRALRDDPGLRARMGQNARLAVADGYSIDRWGDPLADALIGGGPPS